MHGCLQVIKQSLHSPEFRFEDPNYSARAQKADVSVISKKMHSALGVKLSDLTSGRVDLASMANPDSVFSGTGKLTYLLFKIRRPLTPFEGSPTNQPPSRLSPPFSLPSHPPTVPRSQANFCLNCNYCGYLDLSKGAYAPRLVSLKSASNDRKRLDQQAIT